MLRVGEWWYGFFLGHLELGVCVWAMEGHIAMLHFAILVVSSTKSIFLVLVLLR